MEYDDKLQLMRMEHKLDILLTINGINIDKNSGMPILNTEKEEIQEDNKRVKKKSDND